MTDTEDDDMLVRAARAGDDDAFATIFARHRPTATRVAVRAGPAAEADDVVADVFAAVLALLRDGRGPRDGFRPYLLAAGRHEAWRRARRARRCEPVADVGEWSAPVAPPDARLDVDDDLLLAYAALPARWRRTLWQLEVEGRRPRELAGELGLRANAVSALGCRARAALRAAYLERSRAA